MENKYRCDVCKDSGAVETGCYEYSECPCISDDRNFTTSAINAQVGAINAHTELIGNSKQLKFTKGKWKAERKSKNQTCHLVKIDDKYTVHVYDSNYGIEESESWENAKLIAIAPKMYNLLNELKGRLEYFSDKPSVDQIDLLLSGVSEIPNTN